MADRQAYESEAYKDRRYQNNTNGFNIVWNEEKATCEVTCIVRRKAFLFANSILKAIEKVRTSFHNFKTRINATLEYLRPKRRQQQPTADKRQKTQTAKDEQAKAFSPFRGKIGAQVFHYKSMLQANSCDANTVHEVAAWWATLSDHDAEEAKKSYNFSLALAMYRIFLRARKLDDIRRLTSINNVFSRRQMAVIKGYAKNKEQFQDWKREMGMSFSKPYEKQFLS
ncbi:MAG: hypothetical protein LIP09_05415 [Bacteroidales bacterium]|nr:hypothetical protein [Bacteroidales bacterium]